MKSVLNFFADSEFALQTLGMVFLVSILMVCGWYLKTITCEQPLPITEWIVSEPNE